MEDLVSSQGPESAVSIVVPVFNEEAGLPALFAALSGLESDLAARGLRTQVIITDNASTDGSWAHIVQTLTQFDWAEAALLKRNYGFQESILYGLSRAQGDCAIVLQSDLQDPPALVLDFVDAWQSGHATVAGRALSRPEGVTMRFTRHLFYRLLSSASEAQVARGVLDFYLLDRRTYTDVLESKPPLQLLRSYVSEHFGFRHVIDYERRPRLFGAPSLSLSDYYSLALDGLLVSGGRAIKRLTLASFTLAVAALVLATGFFAAYLTGWRPSVAGWLSLALGFLVTISLVGAIGGLALEYLRRLTLLATPGPRARIWERRSSSPLHVRQDDEVRQD